MRALLFILPIAALPACETTAPQSAAMPLEAPAPITIPMDPGTLSCTSLQNPTAMLAASDWTLGRARAAALSGRIQAIPDPALIGSNLVDFCIANPSGTVRAAAQQSGY